MAENGLMPPAAAWRRSGASTLRPPYTMGRCERCRALRPLTRHGSADERLCPSCVAWDRAIAQATQAEPHVRERLYRPRGAVRRVGLDRPAAV